MRILIAFLKWTLILILSLLILAFATGNQFLLKGIWATYPHGYKSASIDDARFFQTRTIAAGNAQPWPVSPDFNKMQLSNDLRQSLESHRSVAFLIAQRGELVYEEYWEGFSEASLTNSFSMAKSITTIAIQGGFIQSSCCLATPYLLLTNLIKVLNSAMLIASISLLS